MPRRLPAEWEPQGGVLLTWPRADGDFAVRLDDVERVFARLGVEIARRERLIVTCADAAHRDHVHRLLDAPGASSIALHVAPSNDVWVRDHGPITVLVDGAPLLLDFRFNGWGGKYPADHDDRLTRALHAQGAFGPAALESVDLVLEGGSIESDGAGTLLTTRRCVLSPTRNGHLSEAQIEQRLADLLGVDRILWLDHGWLAGDDTDGHVDQLARFCDEHTIAHTVCTDPRDEHHAELDAMARELASFRDAHGRPYRLVPLPLPRPRFDADGARLPASYANFLIVDGAVLVPTYDDPEADGVALERLHQCFPGRDIVPVPALPLVAQYGSLHCATMQLPRGVP